MSARTEWYVKVEYLETKTVKVYAVTQTEAVEEARKDPDVMQVLEVKHWSEVENDLNLKEG